MFKDSLFHRPAGDCARNAENNSREAVVRRCSVETVFIKISQNSQENACARVSFLRVSFLAVLIRLQALIYKIREACNFIKKRLLQGFFCAFCVISKNTFFHRTPLVAAFDSM